MAALVLFFLSLFFFLGGGHTDVIASYILALCIDEVAMPNLIGPRGVRMRCPPWLLDAYMSCFVSSSFARNGCSLRRKAPAELSMFGALVCVLVANPWRTNARTRNTINTHSAIIARPPPIIHGVNDVSSSTLSLVCAPPDIREDTGGDVGEATIVAPAFAHSETLRNQAPAGPDNNTMAP